MPTLPLANGRRFTVADSLLDQPAEHILRYQCALSPEAQEHEADELRLERQFHEQFQPPAAGDTLAQLAFEANHPAHPAPAPARALMLLVEQVEGERADNFSDQGLRDRLSLLLAYGLTEAQVQEQHERVAVELQALAQPYAPAEADPEQQAIAVARHGQRRVLALCDVIQEVPTPLLTTRLAVEQALLDLLEPTSPAPFSPQPLGRQRAFDSLCQLLVQQQVAGRLTFLPTRYQTTPTANLLPLGLFLEHVLATSRQLPA
jgi:hypothetical protein